MKSALLTLVIGWALILFVVGFLLGLVWIISTNPHVGIFLVAGLFITLISVMMLLIGYKD
jgi:hypothetical protein